MFLAVNIGNTNIQMGLFADKKLVFRISFAACKTPIDNYYKAIVKTLSQFENIKAVAICSVVASLTKLFQKSFKKYFKTEPLIIRGELNLGIKLNYKKGQLGADRIANAVAAHYLYKRGCIVVDIGTAMTFDIISPKGIYLGGAITPGIGISSEALFSNTSLPEIKNFGNIKFAIGKNTNENLQVGILYGFGSMIEGMLDKFKKKINFKPLIILTGGDADKISKIVNFPHIIDPFITLEGIRIIYERNPIK
ncbi:MAG: type III pantothenate kinase [Candidatus Ratteibacteria bacterium]|nr:type III pantothenate kinase [Candidatus Ratteibacteria bacterium]